MGYRFFRYTKDDGSGNPIFYNRDGTQLAIMEKGINLTTIEGGSVANDDLILKANATDTYSYIRLDGHGNVGMHTDSVIQFYKSNIEFLQMGYNAGLEAYINSPIANINLKLITAGTGVLQFGTYTAGAASDSTGYITTKDAGGTTRKLMVQA